MINRPALVAEFRRITLVRMITLHQQLLDYRGRVFGWQIHLEMFGRIAALAGRALSAGVVSSNAASSRAALVTAGSSMREAVRGFATNSSDIFNVHKESPENNISMEFDFTKVGQTQRSPRRTWVC